MAILGVRPSPPAPPARRALEDSTMIHNQDSGRADLLRRYLLALRWFVVAVPLSASVTLLVLRRASIRTLLGLAEAPRLSFRQPVDWDSALSTLLVSFVLCLPIFLWPLTARWARFLEKSLWSFVVYTCGFALPASAAIAFLLVTSGESPSGLAGGMAMGIILSLVFTSLMTHSMVAFVLPRLLDPKLGAGALWAQPPGQIEVTKDPPESGIAATLSGLWWHSGIARWTAVFFLAWMWIVPWPEPGVPSSAQLAQQLTSSSTRESREAYRELASMGGARVDELITLLLPITYSDSEGGAAQAARTLVNAISQRAGKRGINPLHVRVLIELAGNSNEVVQYYGCRALAEMPRPTPAEAATVLIQALDSSRRDTPSIAANALGRLPAPTPEVVTALLNILADTTRGRVRPIAATNLAHLRARDPAVIEGLKRAMIDRDNDVRKEAARSLETLGFDPMDFVPWIRTVAREDPNPTVRNTAQFVANELDPPPEKPIVKPPGISPEDALAHRKRAAERLERWRGFGY